MKFGLNQKCYLKNFEPKTASNGSPYLQVEWHVPKKGGYSSHKMNFFRADRGFDKDGNLTDAAAIVDKENGKTLDTINHIVSPFLTDLSRAIEKAKAETDPSDRFKAYITALEDALPKYHTTELDLFCQYQYTLKEDKERTFLEVPSNVIHGAFVCKHIPGAFEKKLLPATDNDDIALVFEDELTGERHPFTRTKWFMDSNFATPQGEVKKREPVESDAPDDLPF